MVFDPAAHLLAPFDVRHADLQVETRAECALQPGFTAVRYHIPENMGKEAAEYVDAPVVWHEGEDLADIKPGAKAREEIAGPFDAVRRILYLQEFGKKVFEELRLIGRFGKFDWRACGCGTRWTAEKAVSDGGVVISQTMSQETQCFPVTALATI